MPEHKPGTLSTSSTQSTVLFACLIVRFTRPLKCKFNQAPATQVQQRYTYLCKALHQHLGQGDACSSATDRYKVTKRFSECLIARRVVAFEAEKAQISANSQSCRPSGSFMCTFFSRACRSTSTSSIFLNASRSSRVSSSRSASICVTLGLQSATRQEDVNGV